MRLALMFILAAGVVSAAEPRVIISSDARKKTLDHMRLLAIELQQRLDNAESEKQILQIRLVKTQFEVLGAKAETARTQGNIDKLRDWGVSQQERADRAEKTILKRDKRILQLIIVLGIETALIIAYIAIKLYFSSSIL